MDFKQNVWPRSREMSLVRHTVKPSCEVPTVPDHSSSIAFTHNFQFDFASWSDLVKPLMLVGALSEDDAADGDGAALFFWDMI